MHRDQGLLMLAIARPAAERVRCVPRTNTNCVRAATTALASQVSGPGLALARPYIVLTARDRESPAYLSSMEVDAGVPLASRLESLRCLLGKKATFVRGVGELRAAVLEAYESADAEQQAEMFSLVARVKTLLVSRYTSPLAWRAGCGLFLSAISFMEGAEQQTSLQEWVLLAENEVQDGDLKELRCEAAARHAARCPAKEDRRPVDPAALAMPQAATTEGAGTAEQLLPALDDPATGLDPEEIASRLAEFLREAGLGGSEALSEGTAGLDIRGMMEAMLDTVAEPAGPPPASRDARDALLLKTIDACGQSCAICQEDFEVKDKAKQLPCQHLYHEKCVLVWLEKHNSCPVCRFALESEKQTWDAEASNVQSREAASTGLYS